MAVLMRSSQLSIANFTGLLFTSPVIIILALIPNLKFKVRNELCNYKYTIDLKLVFIIYMNRQQLWKENFPVQIPPAPFYMLKVVLLVN
jgi:hypothetical protein